MALHRQAKSVVVLAILGAILLLGGCGGIDSSNVNRSATSRLSPHPSVILVEPFNIETASVLAKRSGLELEIYKKELTTGFQEVLVERLQKIGPAKKYWSLDDLPDHGWLVKGEFLRVYTGSGILRNGIGFGAGQSVFTTRVYVYDLAVSRDAYILSFDTGITDAQKGSGSYLPGAAPTGGAAGAIARGAGSGTGSAIGLGGASAGAAIAYSESTTRPFPNPTQADEMSPALENQYTSQYQDMARTARQIRDVLSNLSGTPVDGSKQVASAKPSPSTTQSSK